MRHYDRLEQEWRLARLRKLKRLSLFGIMLLFFAAAIVMIVQQATKAPEVKSDTNTTSTPPLPVQEAKSQTKDYERAPLLELKPEFDLSSTTISQPSKNPTFTQPTTPHEASASTKPNRSDEKSLTPTTSQPAITTVLPPPTSESSPPAVTAPPPRLSINAQPATNLVAILQERYKSSPSYATAIALAREHYERGDYHAALSWAGKANDHDPQKSESWAIFAKSHYKLGRKEMARKVLRDYLTRRPNDELRELLAKIERGTL